MFRVRSERREPAMMQDWHDAEAIGRAFDEARRVRRFFCFVGTRALHDRVTRTGRSGATCGTGVDSLRQAKAAAGASALLTVRAGIA